MKVNQCVAMDREEEYLLKKKAYGEGEKAFREGRSVDNPPFKAEDLIGAWQMGWRAAEVGIYKWTNKDEISI